VVYGTCRGSFLEGIALPSSLGIALPWWFFQAICYNPPSPCKNRFHLSHHLKNGEIAMSRRLGWALLVAIGMMLGYTLNSHESTGTILATPKANAEELDAKLADQIGEIKTQVKEINTLLKSGTLRVVVVINPDS
jgi:hypothetical protein